MKINNVASSLIVIAFVLLALLYGQSIIVPFLLALLIWFIVKKIRDMIDKVSFVHKYIPQWLKTALASFAIFSVLMLLGRMMTRNIEEIVSSYQNYASNVEQISDQINQLLNIDLSEEIHSSVHSFFPSAMESISDILGNLMMIFFYTLFLFAEEGLFKKKLILAFSDSNRYDKILATFTKIDKMMSSYISLKSLVGLLTSSLSFIVLWAVGIDSPFFWAALIFLFNFIPSIGSIIATALPALFSLIQFGTFTPFLIILFVVGGIQVLIGNYIEPRLMGNTLNISPLIAIIALALWGAIWGITGMLLSVPITVAMIIVMAQFPKTRSIAILLSEKGKV